MVRFHLSDFTLQLTLKKFLLVKFWCKIREYPQLLEKAIKILRSFSTPYLSKTRFSPHISTKTSKNRLQEPLRWSSGWESACQCRRHSSIPGQGTKIPHTAQQLSLQATTRKKMSVWLYHQCGHKRPCMFLLCSRVSTSLQQKFLDCLERSTPRKDPTDHNQDPTQPKINKQVFFKIKNMIACRNRHEIQPLKRFLLTQSNAPLH